MVYKSTVSNFYSRLPRNDSVRCMSKIGKMKKVLKEIDVIEQIIKPYESYSTDVSNVLSVLDAIKEALLDPEKADLHTALERLNGVERLTELYSEYELATEVRCHLAEIRRIIAER